MEKACGRTCQKKEEWRARPFLALEKGTSEEKDGVYKAERPPPLAQASWANDGVSGVQ